jgi:hypothetical protein
VIAADLDEMEDDGIDFNNWEDGTVRRAIVPHCLLCGLRYVLGKPWGKFNNDGEAVDAACWVDRAVHKFWFADKPYQVHLGFYFTLEFVAVYERRPKRNRLGNGWA